MYEWDRYKSLHDAMQALEDLFATGEVCEGEKPQIVSMDWQRNAGYRYKIMIGSDDDVLCYEHNKGWGRS